MVVTDSTFSFRNMLGYVVLLLFLVAFVYMLISEQFFFLLCLMAIVNCADSAFFVYQSSESRCLALACIIISLVMPSLILFFTNTAQCYHLLRPLTGGRHLLL